MDSKSNPNHVFEKQLQSYNTETILIATVSNFLYFLSISSHNYECNKLIDGIKNGLLISTFIGFIALIIIKYYENKEIILERHLVKAIQKLYVLFFFYLFYLICINNFVNYNFNYSQTYPTLKAIIHVLFEPAIIPLSLFSLIILYTFLKLIFRTPPLKKNISEYINSIIENKGENATNAYINSSIPSNIKIKLLFDKLNSTKSQEVFVAEAESIIAIAKNENYNIDLFYGLIISIIKTGKKCFPNINLVRYKDVFNDQFKNENNSQIKNKMLKKIDELI